MSTVKIKGLRGIFTGAGFALKRGRRPIVDDAAYLAGPTEIVWCRESGQILAVGRSSTKADIELCLDGFVATAGMVDSHTHTLFNELRTDEILRLWSGDSYRDIASSGGGIRRTCESTRSTSDLTLIDKTAKRLRCMLNHGSTTVEVKSGYANCADDELRLLRIIRAAASVAGTPDVRSTFLALHSVPEGGTEDAYVDEMIDALRAVSELSLAHCVDTFPEKGFFRLESAERFSMEATKLGFHIRVHADEITPMGTSEVFTKMGALSVDHLQNISPEAVALLSSAETVAVVLPATSYCLGLPFSDARNLLDSGARVALATDFNPGSAPWMAMQFTMLLAASKLHMTPAEILCAVTYSGAAALGMSASIGSLRVGMRADINLWDFGSGDRDRMLEELCLSMPDPVLVISRGNPMSRCDQILNGESLPNLL